MFSEKNIKKRSDVLFITTAPRVVSLVYNNRQVILFYFIFFNFNANVYLKRYNCVVS